MGNWRNRRYFCRRRSPKPPPSYSYGNEPSSPVFCNDGIPLWEKKFCTSIGKVPWKKIVDTQKFMHNDSVMKWDDSAGKEAFHNAKERFWAHINDTPCHISLPDPDVYIDEIDWNPHVDPELIRDLESVYFVPNDGEKDPKACRRFKRLRYLASENSGGKDTGVGSWNQCNSNGGLKNTRNDHNHWESSFTRENVLGEDKTQGWKQLDDNGHNNDAKQLNNDDNPWDRSFIRGNETKQLDDNGNSNDAKKLNNDDNPWERSFSRGNHTKQLDDNSNCKDAKKLNNNDNPWERSYSQGNETSNKRTWGDCVEKSWGWTQRADHGNLFRNCDNGVDPWKQTYLGVNPVKYNKGWSDSGNNTQCWSQQKSWKWDKGDNPWNPNFSKCTGPKNLGSRDCSSDAWNRGRRDSRGDSWGRKQWDNQNNEPKHLEFERSGGNWGAQYRSCRKREGSHLSSYRSSGYQQDYNHTGQSWRSKNANKRVQFCT